MSDVVKPRPPASTTAGPGLWARLRGSEAGLAVAILLVVALIYAADPGPGLLFDTGASNSQCTSATE